MLDGAAPVRQLTFQVERGIPIPAPPKAGIGNTYNDGRRYPFHAMEVGDSFLVPWDGRPPEKMRASVNISARDYAFRHKHGAKFSTRVVADGVRIWRRR